MKETVRLIVERDNDIILIKRNKLIDGKMKTFYVLPGGIIENGETDLETAKREAYEELDIKIGDIEFFYELYVESLDKNEKFYFVNSFTGTPKNGNGEEFQNQNPNSKYGTYEVKKVLKKEMGAYNILPQEIKDKLVALYI